MRQRPHLFTIPVFLTFLITLGLAISLQGVLGINIGNVLNLGGNKITNVGAPTAAGDAATKGFVDSLPKPAKVLISTIPLAGESSVTLSNIPYYPFYEFIMTGSLTSLSGQIRIRFNNDAGPNYYSQYMGGAAAGGSPTTASVSVVDSGASSMAIGWIDFFTFDGNYLWKGTISNSAAGQWKVVVSTTANEARTFIYTGDWRNTTQAINTITVLFPNTLKPNSWLKLYGRE